VAREQSRKRLLRLFDWRCSLTMARQAESSATMVPNRGDSVDALKAAPDGEVLVDITYDILNHLSAKRLRTER